MNTPKHKLSPLEPTQEMTEAGVQAASGETIYDTVKAIFGAMIAEAPEVELVPAGWVVVGPNSSMSDIEIDRGHAFDLKSDLDSELPPHHSGPAHAVMPIYLLPQPVTSNSPWLPVSHLLREPEEDQLFWFARTDGFIEGPRRPQSGGYDYDEFDLFCACEPPSLSESLLADDLKPDAEPAPTHNLSSSYCKERIAFELTATAQGDSFYGNALRVAKDLPEVSDKARSLLDRYATGSQTTADRFDLLELANTIKAGALTGEDVEADFDNTSLVNVLKGFIELREKLRTPDGATGFPWAFATLVTQAQRVLAHHDFPDGEICPQCDSPIPAGCDGAFADQPDCWRNSPEHSSTLAGGASV